MYPELLENQENQEIQETQYVLNYETQIYGPVTRTKDVVVACSNAVLLTNQGPVGLKGEKGERVCVVFV